jgi:transcriptional regulator with XRE-family HTH domain
LQVPPYSLEQYKRAVAFVLRSLRHKAGLTQEEAAAAAEMDRPHLGHWEQGKFEPGSYRLARLIAVYGYPLDQAVAWIERRAYYYYDLERRRRKKRR